MKPIKSITLIGSGNVATHLGLALHNKGYLIKEVYSNTLKNAKILAHQLGAIANNNQSKINHESDLYIVAIKDDAINDFLLHYPFIDKLTVHTSGTTSINTFPELFQNYGVFYPLQTFSKKKKVDFKNIPVCIEANSLENKTLLLKLANSLSTKVYEVDSKQRKALHVAAVFACNFSNYMYSIAAYILQKENIPFNIIEPLIIETAEKIKHGNPKNLQTGPAIRKDEQIITEHLNYLENQPDIKHLYNFISNKIMEQNG